MVELFYYRNEVTITMNNYLEHHGVKGMKWGVRRRQKKMSSELANRISTAFKAQNEYEASKKNTNYKKPSKRKKWNIDIRYL